MALWSLCSKYWPLVFRSGSGQQQTGEDDLTPEYTNVMVMSSFKTGFSELFLRPFWQSPIFSSKSKLLNNYK
jgi:hypothetical protein